MVVWSPTLREECRLRVFENRTLRRIFGSKRDANGSGEGSTMRNLIVLYNSPNIVRVIKSKRLKWAGHVMEEGRSVFKILTSTPTGKRPLGRPRHRWEDNIRMDLKEIGINMRNRVDSALDRDYWRALVDAGLNFRVSISCGVSYIGIILF